MSIATVLSKLAAGARLSDAEATILAGARATAPERKMLQAMYRGYAGEPEAAAASQFFLTPQPKVADFYAAKRSQQTGKPGHVDRVLVDPENAGEAYGHSTIGLPELGFKDPMYTTARRKVLPEQIKAREQLYAQGGPVSKHPEMEHSTSSYNDASTQPLTGSALKALVRGWIAGTAGLPGDIEGLARKGVNWSFGPGGVNVDPTPTLPTTDFYKEWLPGKQQGDEVLNTLGSLFGGVGATKLIALGKGALSRVAAVAPGPMAGSLAAQRGVIKAPGGNWLSGSVEDALGGLRRHVPTEEALARAEAITPNAVAELRAAAIPDAALNTFIDKQLTRYIKNDMATERDPIRALAERGILHFKPEMVPINPAKEAIQGYRTAGGFPKEGLGKSQLAREWEALTDYPVSTRTAGSIVNDPGGLAPFNIAKDPWLETVAPDTKVYRTGANSLEDSAHFKHLIDELRNATNPNSGLPRELLLKPESLSRVSMPQAVEHVAKINEWRAAQKAEADMARANNAATVLHKDYPEKGMKWVELKTSDALPEGAVTSDRRGYYGGGVGPVSKANAERHAKVAVLKDALKYEGDTMGHCVGGYCDDVASGRSRIFSLRSAKGEPHVTIEVQPQKRWNTDTIPNTEEEIGQRIVQIKGKANRAPNAEYLPYVQDFVKSGQWSDVGDLGNAGLRRTRDAWNENELAKIRAAGKEVPDYLSQEEIRALGEEVWPGQWGQTGYASGGTVRNAVNAAVGGTGLVKAVGNAQTAVGNIASGNASLGDLKALRDVASQLGYTSPGLSQALGLAGVAKAGYNAVTDPSIKNVTGFAATVNPIAAQALGLYNAATDPTPGTFVDAISSFNPIARGYNALANSFNFATLGQLLGNVNKISDADAPAQLRDLFSNNPNSSANAREANALAAKYGIDPMDAMMHVLGVEGAPVPGQTVKDAINAYNQAQALQNNDSLNPASPNFMGPVFSGSSSDGIGGSPASSWGGSFPSYSGGDATNSRTSSSSHSLGG